MLNRANEHIAAACAATLLLLAPGAASAEQISVVAPHAIDGDTLVLGRQRVRLANVDAPKLSEPGGPEARDYLRRLVAGRSVTCDGRARDRYARLVATCSVQGGDLGKALISAGLAKPHVRK